MSKSSRVAEIFLFFGACATEGVSVFSGVIEKFLVGVSSCSWFPTPCGGFSKLSPDRLRSRLSLTACELSKLIHKLLFFKLEKRDGPGCVLSGLNLGLGSAVGVHSGNGLMGDSGDFRSPQRSAKLSYSFKIPSWFLEKGTYLQSFLLIIFLVSTGKFDIS